jgi:hypothetical protein
MIMRHLSLPLFTSLLVLSTGASAQVSVYPPSDTAPIITVKVTAQNKGFWLRTEQAQQIKGSYAMSNGWVLKVRPTSRYIDATIDHEQPMRLQAVSSDKFVSGDGNVIMVFNQGDFGDDMTMSYAPGLGLAQVVLTSAPIAQR